MDLPHFNAKINRLLKESNTEKSFCITIQLIKENLQASDD